MICHQKLLFHSLSSNPIFPCKSVIYIILVDKKTKYNIKYFLKKQELKKTLGKTCA